MDTEKSVLLVHQSEVQHYRVGVYNHLSRVLVQHGWHLTVVAAGVESRCPLRVNFDLKITPLRLNHLCRAINENRPNAVILFANLRELYLFPLILWLKSQGIASIYWGHAIDLEDKAAPLKRLAYSLEHALVDGIILYGDQLRRHVAKRHAGKIFIANNTLNTHLFSVRTSDRAEVLSTYGIRTKRNIICVGRLQRRKRVDDLLRAFAKIPDEDAGLVLVGPDTDGLMKGLRQDRVVWTGPLYGEAVQNLLEHADVYCMPGHLGLSIVDAFYFGLPVVTTDVDHAPEIMYLKHGLNGFMLPRGDIDQLAHTLENLLRDRNLRAKMSAAARQTILEEASIDTMCQGFLHALHFVEHRSRTAGG